MNINTTATALYKGEIEPKSAWTILCEDSTSVLVDVRSESEWLNIGYPDLAGVPGHLVQLSWKFYPEMELNPNFVADLSNKITDKNTLLLFLCRGGGRSKSAAIAMTAIGYKNCYNITHGFEGDASLPIACGWKFDNLPWKQS
jgi:rhodanese-related sulfurtransferase